jgi:hypothetical protein
MGKKSGSGSRIRIRDEKPRLYFRELRKHFLDEKMLIDADSGSGMEKIWIRMEKNRIRDPG